MVGESDVGNQMLNTEQSPLEEKPVKEKLALDSANQNVTPPEEIIVQGETETNSEYPKNMPENEVVECDSNDGEHTGTEKQDSPPKVASGRIGDENGVANAAFDAGEEEPPSVVLNPVSPVENADLNQHTNRRREDEGEENPAFEQDDDDAGETT